MVPAVAKRRMIGLPLDDLPRPKRQYSIGAAVAVVLLVILFGTNLFSILKIYLVPINTDGICPTWDIKRPASYEKDNSTVVDILHDPRFRKQTIAALSGMIQVDTQITDNLPPVDEDPEVWAKFKKFHKHLEKAFPRIYENAEVVKVNTYGLVYIWKGSDESLKPVMLTGHQDVVPVQKTTLGDWTHPPFEGYSDGEKIYGRGAADCKNVVSAIMESLDLLMLQNFKPKRTVIVTLGFDEEANGTHGAHYIGKYLVERFGKDSVYAIVDEGFGLSIDEATNRIVALPATREKGYVDIWAELFTPGGHSSLPPDHTSIGIMGELLMLIERDQFAPKLTPENPTFEYMQCMAVHAGDLMSKKLRKSILRAGYDKFANSHVVQQMVSHRNAKYLIQTSQAMDIVDGGEKVNALPESVKLLTNHRISIESSVKEVFDHFVSRVVAVAKKHDLGVVADGETIVEATKNGHFNVRFNSEGLEVAPKTPSNDDVWKNIAGVTRHIYEDLVFPDMKEPLIVAPSIMNANTDTRHYWDLTEHIYRYTPFFVKSFTDLKVHSVDESISVDNHLRTVAYFYEFLQVVDESG